MKTTRTVNVQISHETHKKLKAVSKSELRTMRDWCFLLITDAVDKKYAKLKEVRE